MRRGKNRGGLEKWLANPGSRKKITKTTRARRGQETKWGIPIQMKSRLDRVVDWTCEAKQAGYCVATLADRCRVTERQLRRYFHMKFGISPHLWLVRERLRPMKEQLLRGDLVKEVAYEAGFIHQENFSRTFKQHNQVSPTEFRSKHCLNP